MNTTFFDLMSKVTFAPTMVKEVCEDFFEDLAGPICPA